MSPLASPQVLDAGTAVTSLRTQHGAGLIGISGTGIRLSWQVRAATATAQLGYQIAHGPTEAAATEHVGDPVASDRAVGVSAGDLAPGQRRWFTVRIATEGGWTAWADPIAVEAGLGGRSLRADVVGIPAEIEGPAQYLRREFSLERAPEWARLRLSAAGVVDAWINGQLATDAVLTPGWTSYGDRILIDTLDVAHLLRAGTNTIVLAVSDGWYRGRMGFSWRTEIYGTEIGAIAQIETEAGIAVATDASWRGGFGEITQASIYDGTTIDLRKRVPGLHEAGFDDSHWQPVTVLDVDKGLFAPRNAPPVRVVAELPMTRAGENAGSVWDAGQNITGWVRLVVRGRAGDEVTIRHAEVLEPSGELHTVALRSAKAIDRYLLDADGTHTLQPVFTFHGFQYAEVTGAEVVEATAIAISSDLAAGSSFTSSHAALNQFHSNVLWSQRDNFVSVPTDCPQRDERLGWTGDAQAFAATANTLMDSEAFWLSWLIDLEADQTDEGGVASIVPDIIRFGDMLMGGVPVNPMGRAGWADAATIVPFAVYQAYGSTEVLGQQLPSMRRWVEHLRRRAGTDLVLPTEPFQYGDWLDPDAPGERPWQAKVSADYVANAFYVHSTRLLARAERLVGDAARGADYAALAEEVREAMWRTWGAEAVTTQTGAALALEFDLAPPGERAGIAAGLAANVRAEAGRIATGFLGTPLVLSALSRNGYLEAAYLMLLRREAPSWLYQVDRGATTVWERWDAIAPDGSINAGDISAGAPDGTGDTMISFNHYAYGAMIDWVYHNVAGLAPTEPGYRRVRVGPRPATELTSAAATIHTRYGDLSIDWRLDDGDLEARLTVPFGVSADLDLPVTGASVVTINGGSPVPVLAAGTHTITVTAARVVTPA